jgi:ATP phosphoribosyltransferase
VTAAPLILAIPSKGRLQDDSRALFTSAGLAFAKASGERRYRDRLTDMAGVEVAYLSAPEIAREIGAGAVHLGITGRDQVEESIPDWKAKVEMIAPLGFGQCEIVVAVPEPWIDVAAMADLDDVAADFRRRHGRRLTVATKYVTLTRRFFADHGIADYRIVESLGATEGAPASGAADLIVDLTSTGATLKANGLKVVPDGIILASEAHIVSSRTATWSAGQRKTLTALLGRLKPALARVTSR